MTIINRRPKTYKAYVYIDSYSYSYSYRITLFNYVLRGIMQCRLV